MAVHDFNAQRLFVDGPLSHGQTYDCPAAQVNYLMHVLRLAIGDEIRVFNGRDGEWLARVDTVSKRSCHLRLIEQVRAQESGQDLWYCFAPLKRARLDYMVQKAVEMGVSVLQPTLTRFTVAERVKLERMRANAIEAAEQCGILALPDVREPLKLAALIDAWPRDRVLIYCDEAAPVGNPIAALSRIEGLSPGDPMGLLIGPEGGFSGEERERLAGMANAHAISLGPRIMRADTAAVAALAVLNAAVGDWRA